MVILMVILMDTQLVETSGSHGYYHLYASPDPIAPCCSV